MPTFRSITVRAAAAAALATVMTLSVLPAATLGYQAPPPETKQAEKDVLAMINAYRDRNGLKPLRMDYHVRKVARARSRDMRDRNYFSHVSPSGGSAGSLMHNRGIQHWGWGENIGRISFLGWNATNQGMVEGWKGSPGHNQMLLSRDYNYIGVGLARNSYGAYYTLVFVKQPDHTPPRAGMVAANTGLSIASGSSGTRAVTIKWWGADRPLQQYTSGLKGFVVQKWSSGGWKTLRSMTTSRQMTLNLSEGNHKFRVKAVDRRGNRGKWQQPLKVTVY
jgi:uncharacterized protein YkwD